MDNSIQSAAIEMAREHRRTLADILYRYRHKDSYYLLFYTYQDPMEDEHIIRTKAFLLTHPPRPPQMGTILYHVDNKKGKCVKIGVWLKDNVAPDWLLDERENNIKDIIASVQDFNLPIEVMQMH